MTQHDGHGLLHMELPEESMCLGIRLVSAGQILLLHRDKVFESSWSTLAHMIDGFVGFKETMFFRIMKEDPQLEQSDSGLLDLLAAASSPRKRPAAVLQPEATPRNEGEVDVDRELLQLLQQEVDEALRDVDSRTNTAFASTVCPCCPWRRFDKRANLRRHLRSQHTEAKRYCPSGTKQLRIASALYDHDAITGKTMQTGFLARSSDIIRSDVKPPIPTKSVRIDKTVRYVMDNSGPRILTWPTATEPVHMPLHSAYDLRGAGPSADDADTLRITTPVRVCVECSWACVHTQWIAASGGYNKALLEEELSRTPSLQL